MALFFRSFISTVRGKPAPSEECDDCLSACNEEGARRKRFKFNRGPHCWYFATRIARQLAYPRWSRPSRCVRAWERLKPAEPSQHGGCRRTERAGNGDALVRSSDF